MGLYPWDALLEEGRSNHFYWLSTPLKSPVPTKKGRVETCGANPAFSAMLHMQGTVSDQYMISLILKKKVWLAHVRASKKGARTLTRLPFPILEMLCVGKACHVCLVCLVHVALLKGGAYATHSNLPFCVFRLKTRRWLELQTCNTKGTQLTCHRSG